VICTIESAYVPRHKTSKTSTDVHAKYAWLVAERDVDIFIVVPIGDFAEEILHDLHVSSAA